MVEDGQLRSNGDDETSTLILALLNAARTMKPLCLANSLRLGLGILATLSPLVVQGSTVDPTTTTYTLSHRFSTQETSQPHSRFTLPLPSLSDPIDLSPESVLLLNDDSTSGKAGAGAGESYHLHLSGDGVDLETSTKAVSTPSSPLHYMMCLTD